MKKCVVCGKVTEKKHLLANVLVLFDPDKEKVIWEIVFGGDHITLCANCTAAYKNKLLKVKDKIEQALFSTKAEDTLKKLN